MECRSRNLNGIQIPKLAPTFSYHSSRRCRCWCVCVCASLPLFSSCSHRNEFNWTEFNWIALIRLRANICTAQFTEHVCKLRIYSLSWTLLFFLCYSGRFDCVFLPSHNAMVHVKLSLIGCTFVITYHIFFPPLQFRLTCLLSQSLA